MFLCKNTKIKFFLYVIYKMKLTEKCSCVNFVTFYKIREKSFF